MGILPWEDTTITSTSIRADIDADRVFYPQRSPSSLSSLGVACQVVPVAGPDALYSPSGNRRMTSDNMIHVQPLKSSSSPTSNPITQKALLGNVS